MSDRAWPCIGQTVRSLLRKGQLTRRTRPQRTSNGSDVCSGAVVFRRSSKECSMIYGTCRLRWFPLPIAIVLAVCCRCMIADDVAGGAPGENPPDRGVQTGRIESVESSTALRALFSDEWQRTLKEEPTNASQLGDRRYNRLWPDVSLIATRQSQQRTREALKRLLTIDRSALSEPDQLNHPSRSAAPAAVRQPAR